MDKPFVHTSSPNISPNSEIYQKSIYTHTGTCLISLIHALSSNNFGYDSLVKGINTILDFKKKYLTNEETLFLDSAGYSIISGEVPSHSIYKFIGCYVKALEILKDDVDYIFQLDIPIFLNEPEMCTYDNIYNFNQKSLVETIKEIEKYPQIKEKFLFVLQFKIKEQYLIWDSLYNSLEFYRYHKYYSVGGLVSLYEICPNVNFAPFIGPIYYWLYYYHKHSNYQYPYFIHILGTYHKFTRFAIMFMIQLINKYLEPYNQKGYVTYDSVNYTLSALFKSRVGLEYYQTDDDTNLMIKHSHDLSDQLLNNIYVTEDCLNSYKENIKRIDDGKPLTDTTFLVPLNIRSQLNLDDFFLSYIKKHNLVELMLSYDNPLKFLNNIKPYINKLANYPTLTNNFTSNVLESLRIIFIFNNWYLKNKDDKNKLDELMFSFIKKINFPFNLK